MTESHHPIEIQIAVPSPVHHTFTYTHDQPIQPGVRVIVPFGARPKTIGVVLPNSTQQNNQASDHAKAPPIERDFVLRAIKDVLDDEPIYSKNLLSLAQWMAGYYIYPIGEVLRTMLPASAKNAKRIEYTICLDSPKELLPQELLPKELFPKELLPKELFPKELFPKKGTLGHITLRNKIKKLNLSSEPEKLIKKWIREKKISAVVEKNIATRKQSGTSTSADLLKTANHLFRNLNHYQQQAYEQVRATFVPQADGMTIKPILLYGVTGSGKTEVFLHAIRHLTTTFEWASDLQPQALVMVPEISLTPQMTRIFEERFPGMVAVVHSAMEDSERWAQLDRIRTGDALILIGPRSAVFGPFQNLKLIIVDEEHDSSYKQGNGLLYNARDIAIMRGQLEQATVVLGSATPSMESWHNALTGKYNLVEMPERASTRPMPAVETISCKPAFKAISLVNAPDQLNPDESPFDSRVIAELQQNYLVGHQSIVLVNRRGYAYYLLNVEDRVSAGCPHCSISLSVHGRRGILRCHYCDYKTTVQSMIAQQPDKTWAVVGYGSQKAEDHLKLALPNAKIARLDSDIVQDPKALPEILGSFRRGEIDLLVGTQILAKGHDFPNVTLIAILEVDQLLGMPDFRGGERTFQLLVQAAGRSGRGQLPGRVLVQSMRAGHPIVQRALHHDFKNFAVDELKFRQAMSYPPFGKMILFEFSGIDMRQLDQWCQTIENALVAMMGKYPDLAKQVHVLGPATASIAVIRGRSRRTLILLSKFPKSLRLVANYLATITAKPSGDLRVKIDVDPQSTM